MEIPKNMHKRKCYNKKPQKKGIKIRIKKAKVMAGYCNLHRICKRKYKNVQL
jgi:hypothetical protein